MTYALLIDDDADLVERIKSTVATYGFEISTASNWDEGFELFNANAPDLVIADYNLPGSKLGLRLLYEISRLRPSVRLVLFSAYLNETDVAKVLELGLVDRAFRKVDPVVTAEAVIEEVERAAGRSMDATDWAAFGRSTAERTAVSEEDLDKLDSYLSANRLPGNQSEGKGPR